MRFFALLFFTLFSCLSARSQHQKPNIVLVTLDTVRADRMGFLGAKFGITPNLDALAQRAFVYTNAYSQVPLTTASHATILTGTYPQFHGVNDFGKPLSPELPTLPALLKAQGYTTAAFVGSVILDAKSGLAPGFDRGFDVYDAGYHVRRSAGENRYSAVERRAFDVVQRAIAWLGNRPSRPFFLWVHLYDAHDPYEAPAPYTTRGGSAYNGEVAYDDAAVGKLLAALRTNALLDSSALLVTADHGEALGAHGERTHGVFLYDETIRVPLLLKLPSASLRKRISRPVQLVDLAPTLLKLAGSTIPAEMQGKSLLVPSQAEETPYAETHYPSRAFGWSALAALRSGKYLYVRAPRRELYDTASDPNARKNIAGSSSAIADVLGSKLDDFRQKTAAGARESASATTSAEQAQQLAALGYASGNDQAPKQQNVGKAIDPKDKVDVANTLHDAIFAVEEGQFEKAQPLLERVVKDDPQIYTAQYQLGLAYSKQKRFKDAIPHLKAATAIQADSAIAHYELGLALFESGDLSAAAPEFETTTRITPKWADAQFALGSVYARTDRVRDALDHLQTAIELDQNHFRANLLAGRILALQGRPDVGVALLERAVKLKDDDAEAHAFLADAYRKVGRTAEAEAQQRKSQELNGSKQK
jgi:arylsulfatase A-like enzyme/Tfp pilus assembly protein PilF